jgi:hypothetical protein
VFEINPVINCKNSITILENKPIATTFFIRKFDINGSPKPNGIIIKILRSDVSRSTSLSVISGIRFTVLPAAIPFSIRFGKKCLRRSKD